MQRTIELASKSSSISGTIDLPASKSISNRLLILEAISKALTPDYSHDARFFGVPAPVQIKTGKGTGKILVEITSSGWVKKVAFDYNIEIESLYKREPFTQKIETNSVWTLLGRYKW